MTSTSFNPIQLQQTTMQQQPLSLKQGQVFHGTIKKLYPDQMAEIQIGNQKLFAKLETPLKVGDSHFFQVTNINPQAELKVVTGPMQAAQPIQAQMNQLMETMNLPKSSEMQIILAHFIKNQLPITKETLIQAENFLKNLPEGFSKQDAAAAIQKMVEAKMPFTKEVFNGLLYGAKTNGIAENISNLTKMIMENSSILPDVKTKLLQPLQTIAKPFEIETGGIVLSKSLQTLMNQNEGINSRIVALNLLKDANVLPQNATLSNWLSQSFTSILSTNNNDGSNPTLNNLLQTMATVKAEVVPKMLQEVKVFVNKEIVLPEQKQQILQLINRFEALPKTDKTIELFAKQLQEQMTNITKQNASFRDLVKSVATTSEQNVSNLLNELKTSIQNQSLLSSTQKEQIVQLLNRFEALPKTEQTITLFAKQLHEQLVKNFSEQGTKMFEVDIHGYSKKDQLLSLLKPDSIINANTALTNLTKVANESAVPFIQNLIAQADGQVQASIDGKAMEQAIKKILKSLGMSFEASLNSKPENIQDNIQSLKPQLLSLIQDVNTSSAMKEVAENILSRLNGMQLHSGENGVQHQLVMQIPLHFFGKNTDATVQWNGRMGKNGKIDSNFARILFYLNMEAIKETMIDMQVQNRIVTINVYNEHTNLEIFAEPLKESLKNGLLEKNYQLSGLFIKQFEKGVSQNVTEKSKNLEKGRNLKNGVDYRV